MSHFFVGPLRVQVSADDWAKADGAMLTPDDRVLPAVDLTPQVSNFAIQAEQEVDVSGYARRKWGDE